MVKIVDDSVLDGMLNEIKTNCDQMTACVGQPATFYEGNNPPLWVLSTAYALGDSVHPTVRDGNTYECTTAGTSAGTEPAWDTTPGNTTADNTVVWTARADKSLAAQAMVTGDFTLANGDTNGRKNTIAAKSAISVYRTATADHVALLDTVNFILLYVTTATGVALTSGGTVDIGSWKIEVADPT